MKIEAIKLREGGFTTQPLVFGGEEGREAFDINVKYRSGLTNYLIDTGSEVILVDTALPVGTPEEVPTEQSLIYTGKDVSSYMDAFHALGYKEEQVTKILLTHKHADHSGQLKNFPNETIYVGSEDASSDELKGLDNVVAVEFKDGAYHNFPESEKIAEGIYFVKAKGHTLGNSLVMVEDDGLFYMIHGDITYTDEALYENKLSIVFEDPKEARVTLDRVREFIAHNPTVYLSTHTPLGYENLEAKRVVDLNNPIETLPVTEVTYKTKTGKYVCSVCGYVYDPAVGDESQGIAPGTRFEDLPADWHCPRCKQDQDKFNAA